MMKISLGFIFILLALMWAFVKVLAKNEMTKFLVFWSDIKETPVRWKESSFFPSEYLLFQEIDISAHSHILRILCENTVFFDGGSQFIFSHKEAAKPIKELLCFLYPNMVFEHEDTREHEGAIVKEKCSAQSGS